jgi:hypothetical protein
MVNSLKLIWLALLLIAATTPSFVQRGGYAILSPAPASIGSTYLSSTQARFFNGGIDEARIGTSAPSAATILAEYNNQKLASSFYTLAQIH